MNGCDPACGRGPVGKRCQEATRDESCDLRAPELRTDFDPVVLIGLAEESYHLTARKNGDPGVTADLRTTPEVQAERFDGQAQGVLLPSSRSFPPANTTPPRWRATSGRYGTMLSGDPPV
jgi:hypothetical protein